MILYYNTDKQCLVDEFNCQINLKPVLYFGEKPIWELQLYQGELGSSPQNVDVSHVIAWRAAVDSDWDHATSPMCRTPDGIDKSAASDGRIGIPLDANTTTFLASVGHAQSRTAFLEVRGFDAKGNVVLVIVLNIICHNALDPEGGEVPEAPESDSASKAWTQAILSQPLIWEYSADLNTWHSTLAPHVDLWQRVRHGADGLWSDPMPIPYGKDGLAVVPDMVDELSQRPAVPADGFCFVDTVEGKTYWFIGGQWTAGVPLTTVVGPVGPVGPEGKLGIQGKEGPLGKQGIQGNDGKQGKQGEPGLKGDPGDGLKIDATGTLANRHNYDAAARGFAYMATDLYCDTITGKLLYTRYAASDDGAKAFAWSDGEKTVYTKSVNPQALDPIYSDKVCTVKTDTVTATAQKYQQWYQKTSADLGAWSAGIRVYSGKQGETGKTGPEGKQGPQGKQGENAAVAAPIEFGTSAAGSLEIIANSVMFNGIKPIATVELYYNDPDDPDEKKSRQVTHLVTIEYCDTDNRTHVFFAGEDLDLSLGGRIRFAQGISGVSPYQEYLAAGGSDDYLTWYSHLSAGIPEAPADGKTYARKSKQWVQIDSEIPGVTPGPEPGDDAIYYGYITDPALTSVTQITAAHLEQLTRVTAAELGKTSLGIVPAGSWPVVIVPAGYAAFKDDGLGGLAPFALDNGMTGTGANGIALEDIGRVYGEFKLAAAEIFIYVRPV